LAHLQSMDVLYFFKFTCVISSDCMRLMDSHKTQESNYKLVLIIDHAI
jgi:hypothetical protein